MCFGTQSSPKVDRKKENLFAINFAGSKSLTAAEVRQFFRYLLN
jgi:hypothetical protein